MASIRKRTWTANGKAGEAWVVDYKDQHGKRRLKTFDKKKDADAWVRTALHEVGQGTHTPDSASITVKEAAERWLDGRRVEGVERSTAAQYRQHIDYHIAPLIGAEKLSRLTTPKVEEFKRTLLKTRSRALAKKVLQSLRSLITDAQRNGLIAQNVARGVTISSKADKRRRRQVQAGVHFPTKEEVKLLLEHAAGRWRPLIVTAIFTGMRASELRGLTWDNVDVRRKVIRVTQRADRWDQLDAPKSDTSKRQIPMTPMVVNALKEWKLRCPHRNKSESSPGELYLVFPNGVGKVESLANIWNRALGPLQIAAGVAEPVLEEDGKPKLDDKGKRVMRPKYGMHALRHFYASWLIDQGFPPKKVQTLVGHASIQMTFDVYGHLFPSLDDDHAKLEAGELALVQ